MEMEHVAKAMLYPHRAVVARPEDQFEACRALRADNWSHYRIACALGISPQQARVATSGTRERWAA